MTDQIYYINPESNKLKLHKEEPKTSPAVVLSFFNEKHKDLNDLSGTDPLWLVLGKKCWEVSEEEFNRFVDRVLIHGETIVIRRIQIVN